jgi:hypothetical protein
MIDGAIQLGGEGKRFGFFPFKAGCIGGYRYEYEPELVDENGVTVPSNGFLHVAHVQRALNLSGPIGDICNLFKSELAGKLEGELPGRLDGFALDQVSVNLASRDPSGDQSGLYTCEPVVGGPGEPIGDCTKAADRFWVAVESGAKSLPGISPQQSLPPNIKAALTATVINGATTAKAGNAPVRPKGNWSCINRPDPPQERCGRPTDHFRCQFVLRAKHVVVEPDAIDLTWFDRMDDYQMPGLALFFASFFQPNPPSKLSQFPFELCQRNPRFDKTNSSYNEWFATTHDDTRQCPKNSTGFHADRCCIDNSGCEGLENGSGCQFGRCRGGACNPSTGFCTSGADRCVNGTCVPIEPPETLPCDVNDPFTCPPDAICENGGYGPECRSY